MKRTDKRNVEPRHISRPWPSKPKRKSATNKTQVANYRAAIGPDTRVLLKVHQSDFRTIGFTAETEIAELAMLGSGTVEVTDVFAGGGSLPEERIMSWAVALPP